MEHLTRPEFLVFGAPLITEEDIAEVVATLRSGWIGTGPKVTRFEELFRQYKGAAYALAMSSCTAALEIALEVVGVGPGDEVITTPLTFAATANVIVHRGARPVFADVDRRTGNILPGEIEKHMGPRTRALIPVHLAGRPCDMDVLMPLAQQHGLHLIEDAAHAIETVYHGRKAGTLGDFGAFSFYPTKSLTTGEGGMLLTQRPEWAEKAKLLRLHGISADAWSRYSESGFKHYETVVPGYKHNMTDLQAALALHQMERLEKNLAYRAALWDIYEAGLAELPGLHLPPAPEPDTTHARHLYTVCVDPDEAGQTRDGVMTKLKDLKVGAGVHYTALHLHRYYRDTFGYQRGDFPNAEWIADRTLSLPLGMKMSPSDAEYVVEAMRYALGH